MFWKLVCILVLLTAGGDAGASTKLPYRLSSQFPVIGHGSAVINLQGQSAIGIVGPITPDIWAKARELILADGSIKIMYVDSNGGDVLSALKLAEVVREKNIRLVVAGRCFSACANYLFVGSRRKDILPGSLIAIHGKQINLWNKEGVVKTMSPHDDAIKIKAAINSRQEAELDAVRRAEARFYKQLGFSGAYQLAFEQYEQKRSQGKMDASGCPQIQMWVLSKSNFREMGITGIDAAWSPGSEDEARIAAGQLGLQAQQIFFGSLGDFGKLCGAARAGTWLQRWFAS